MNLYLYIDDNILTSSTVNTIRFTPSKTFSVEKDNNLRIIVVNYIKGQTKWSNLPSSMRKIINDKNIDINGDIHLLPSHTVNGLTFYLKGTYHSYLFSCFIDHDTPEMQWKDCEVGGYLRIPDNYFDLYTNQDIVNLINTSQFYYCEGQFDVANILGVDLKDEKVLEKWENTIPYGNYPRLYLNEAEIIAAFIKHMRECYPEIEFFPQSSERKNLGKETVFYQSRLLADRSFRFNSNVLFEQERGRWYQTTIPLILHYQTSDISQYSHRRSEYLLSHFFMDVHYFNVTKKRGYKDRFGNDSETFEFATYWERDIGDDLVKQDAPDGSGRDTFTITIQCDLICSVIERSEEPVPIQDVIMNLYFH